MSGYWTEGRSRLNNTKTSLNKEPVIIDVSWKFGTAKQGRNLFRNMMLRKQLVLWAKNKNEFSGLGWVFATNVKRD